MNGIKKTALFLSGLDFAAVDTLLSRLDADSARQIRREMLSIKHGSISSGVSDKIDNEFIKKAGWTANVRQRPAVETFDRKSAPPARSATAPATYPAPKPQPRQPKYTAESFVPSVRPFGFLQDWSDEDIAAAVAGELPQTAAVILANIPQSRAKEILLALPPKMQNEVTVRLAHYEEPPPIAVEEIEAALLERSPARSKAGVSRSALSRLERLNDKELSLVFHSVDLRIAVTALVGMKPEFIERVTKRFSPTEEYEMRLIVKHLGSVRQEDIDAAREKIAIIMEN